MWRVVWRLLYWAYLPLAVLAALVPPLEAMGLLRTDPFMTVLALILGIPWSILFPFWVDSSWGLVNYFLLCAALAVNAWLLRLLIRWRRRRPLPEAFADDDPDYSEAEEEEER